MTLDTTTTTEALPQSETLLANIPLPLVGMFYPLGFPVQINTNHEAILEAANASWGHERAREDTPAIQILVCITDGEDSDCPPSPLVRLRGHLLTVVADFHNHAVCDIRNRLAHIWLNRSTLMYQSYIRYHFIEVAALFSISTSFVTPLHAACVSRHGQGMLLCGDSGTGKSTLAYACARAGWSYTSDDASYLIRDANPPHVLGSSHQVRFRPTARTLFPELFGYGLTPRAEGKPSIEIPIAELLPHVVSVDEAQVHFMVFLKREPIAVPELIPIPTETAMQRLKVGEGLGREMEEFYSSCIQHLVHTQSFELHYSDLHPAIECLDSLAREAVRQV